MTQILFFHDAHRIWFFYSDLGHFHRVLFRLSIQIQFCIWITAYRKCSHPICVSRGTLSFSWISALFSMATTITAIQMLSYNMLPSRIILNIMRQRQKHRKLECTVFSVLPSLQWSQNSEVCRPASCILSFSAWHSTKTFSMFSKQCLMCLLGVRKWQTKKKP